MSEDERKEVLALWSGMKAIQTYKVVLLSSERVEGKTSTRAVHPSEALSKRHGMLFDS